jgi:DNA-binding transcriptional LysR family regulator
VDRELSGDAAVPELKHLRYFVAVAEELNFSAAARREYVSQQALSRIIQQLEAELGVLLFERTTRSVRLTAAGEAMLAAARRSAAAADEAFDSARSAHRGEVGRPLRIEIGSGSLQTAAHITRRARRDHPHLAMRQSSLGVMRGLEALVEGRLDIVLGLASHAPAEVASELIRRELMRVAMSTDHRLSAQDTVGLTQLGDYELLLPSEESGSEWNQFVSMAWAQAGVRVRPASSTVHGSTITVELLRESDVVLPTLSWADPPAGIAFRPLVEPELSFPWSLMTSAASGRQPEVLHFLESARGIAHEQNWLWESDDDELSAGWLSGADAPA